MSSSHLHAFIWVWVAEAAPENDSFDRMTEWQRDTFARCFGRIPSLSWVFLGSSYQWHMPENPPWRAVQEADAGAIKLIHFDVKEQKLHSELLPICWASHTLFYISM